MPAEWHPHESTWLTWPKNEETWPSLLPEVEQAYIELINLLLQGENVDLLVDSPETAASIRKAVNAQADFELRAHRIPTIDSWIRDYGPNFLLGPSSVPLVFNNWEFNAWGEKYPDLIRDDRVNEEIAALTGVPRFEPEMILEGGSIEVNGRGLCLTTRQCLLNPNRNPSMTLEEIEERVSSYLGLERIVWLNRGIEGDDTDGHIDDIARFIGEETVICAVEEDPDSPNYAVLRENFEILSRLEEEGLFEVRSLPMPEPVEVEGMLLPASYANFYITNRALVVPLFGQKRDRRALETLRALSPDRPVVGIEASSMVYGLGALHCLTQQQPRSTHSS